MKAAVANTDLQSKQNVRLGLIENTNRFIVNHNNEDAGNVNPVNKNGLGYLLNAYQSINIVNYN